jgi:hypothetical protein
MDTGRRHPASAVLLIVLSVTACATERGSVGPEVSVASAVTRPGGDGRTRPDEVFGPVCADLPGAEQPGGLITMSRLPGAQSVAANPLLGQFSSALVRSGLVETVDTSSNLTIFAPVDSVLAGLVLPEDPAVLAEEMRGYLVSARYNRDGLMRAGSVSTMNGTPVAIGLLDRLL